MRSFQLKLSYLLSAIVIALALYASQPVEAQPVAATEWEYAHVISALKENVAFAYMADLDEQAAIQEALDALDKNNVGTLTILNILGGYGWELSILDSSQQANGFLAFIMKRPAD